MRKSDQLRHLAAFQAGKATPGGPDHTVRIDALTRNARSTWFGLLAVLVFVGVTLAGVEHIDFYGVDRATQLPLVNVSVPTRLFFLAAPMLTAAIYIYFHLYLIRLFDALGAAPARVGKDPLSQAIAPWLINDAVLWVRRRHRDDDCHPKRPMEAWSALVNFALVWGFGLLVLGYSWYAALPARDYLMNGIGALAFSLALMFAVASGVTLQETARAMSPERTVTLRLIGGRLMAAVFVALAALSFAFANPNSPVLARLDLTGQQIVDKPLGWLPYQIARRDFLDVWRKREGLSGEDLSDEGRTRFDEEWQQRRALALADLERPEFNGQGAGILLRDAQMSRAFLSGLNLRFAQMEGVDLGGAQMEGVDLSRAQMEGADLRFAQMEGADLSRAQMEGADLRAAQMEGADLSFTQMEGADLRAAQMEGANLSFTQMEGVDLGGAQMEGVDLIGAQMEGADLSRAQMQGADLIAAQMEGANLSYSLLTGRAALPTVLKSTNLMASVNKGGAIRFVDLREIEFDSTTDFRNAFMDGSVVLLPEFAARLGDQCQNLDDPAENDAAFYGHWRGWVEHETNPDASIWEFIAPPEFADVASIPPPPGCVWKTGPMPEWTPSADK